MTGGKIVNTLTEVMVGSGHVRGLSGMGDIWMSGSETDNQLACYYPAKPLPFECFDRELSTNTIWVTKKVLGQKYFSAETNSVE